MPRSTRTLLITVPQYFTLAPYKSHTDLPYKHSKLAQLAKIRGVVCEDEIAVKSMPTSRSNFGLFTSILRRFYGRLCGPNSSSRSLSFALFIIGRIFECHNAEMSFGKLKRGGLPGGLFNRHFESPRPGFLVWPGDINKEK